MHVVDWAERLKMAAEMPGRLFLALELTNKMVNLRSVLVATTLRTTTAASTT